jgi:AraC-like DNA-binding protein
MDNLAISEGFIGQKLLIFPKNTLLTLKTNTLTSPFHITDIGHYPNATHHLRERKRGAKQYIFIYCTSGEGWLEEHGDRKTIGPNEFVIIEKNRPHRYGASESSPWTILWMHFSGNLAASLYERYAELSDKERKVSYLNDRVQLFYQIFEVLSENYNIKNLEYSCLLSLNFISSFIFNKQDKHSNNFKKSNLVQNIIQFLNENLDKTYKSEDLTNLFHYSSSHILSTFKKNTGFSLFQFFNMKKVQKACEYLNYTDLTIKEISFRLGFQDPLYFSRLFKSHMGISPRKYRKGQVE